MQPRPSKHSFYIEPFRRCRELAPLLPGTFSPPIKGRNAVAIEGEIHGIVIDTRARFNVEVPKKSRIAKPTGRNDCPEFDPDEAQKF